MKRILALMILVLFIIPLMEMENARGEDTKPPVAIIGELPEEVAEDTTITLDASQSTTDSVIIHYYWYISIENYKGRVWGWSGDESIMDVTLPEPGQCYIQLKVLEEGCGIWGMVEDYIWVIDTTPPEIVCNENITILKEGNVTLDASESTDNECISNYTWEVENRIYGGSVNTIIFDDVGIFTVNLTLTDNRNNNNTTSFIVNVLETIPTINLTINGEVIIKNESYHLDREGELCVLDASKSYSPIDIIDYRWQIEDKFCDGEEILFRPPEEREYGILLTVTNERGEKDSGLFYITIGETIENMTENVTDNNISPETKIVYRERGDGLIYLLIGIIVVLIVVVVLGLFWISKKKTK